MATMKRPRLDAVEALPRERLKLTFVDGSIHTVSLAKDIERLPGLAPLKDSKAFRKANLVAGKVWEVEHGQATQSGFGLVKSRKKHPPVDVDGATLTRALVGDGVN